MTPCPPPQKLELLTASRLGADEQAAVTTHVAGCGHCQQTLASLTPCGPTQQWQPTSGSAPETGPADAPDGLLDHPRYRVVGVLGRGGMGAAYRAEHRLLERPVVLKVIRPELVANPAIVARFQREARLAARLAHPNVVAVYEAEEYGPTQMLVMEFVDGVTFAQLVGQRGLLPVAEACELIRQAAVGLEHIHAQGLVHRDIKPHNLMVSTAGQVKVLDLGLATLRGGARADGGELTAERQFVGTVDYAAPEQWENSRDVDIRADVYSLGCTFYYLLAGEAPFPNKRYSTLMQQMWAHSQAPLPPIREVRPDVPEAVASLLARMMAKRPEERFDRPGQVAAALAPFTEGCDLTGYVQSDRRTTTSTLDLSRVSSGAARPPAPAARRAPRWWAAAAVAALLGAVALAGTWYVTRPGPRGGMTGPAGEPIKVGVLHSRTGTMAISERGVIDATLLAIDEVNETGGLLGRPVVAVVEDGESDGPTFAARAEKLITRDRVCSVFGCWTSASRKTVLPVVERHDHLLFYPVQYEGLEQSPNVVYTGAAPNQQLIPALKWAVSSLGKKRFFLVGSDYVFPRTAHAILRDVAAKVGAEIVGEEYVLLGSPDVAAAVGKVVAARPDAILNTINGDSNVAFFRALRAAGVTPDRVPTVSFSISEEELDSLNGREVAGDYAAWNYFQGIDRPRNQEFLRRFQARHGKHRAVSDPMESAYCAVHLWAQGVREAGRDDVAAIRQAVRHQAFESPVGRVRVDPETQHVSKVFRVGRITREGRFEVVYSSDAPIAPIPYPDTRRKGEWDAFLMDLHLRWGGQWANPGKR